MTIAKLLLLASLLLGPALRAMLTSTLATTGPASTSPAAVATRPADVPSRFETVEVYIDTADKPLAAYQFTLRATTNNVLLAGLEGGEHAAFAKPPYYDTHALIDEQVIVAAFSTDAELPAGKTRVVRLTVQVIGPQEPQYEIKLHVAAGVDGTPIPATASVKRVLAGEK